MNRSLRAGGAVCLGIVSLFLAHAMPARAQDASTLTVTYPNSTQSSDPLWSAPPARASVAGEVPKEQPIHPLPQGGAPVPGGEHANDRALQNKAGNHLSVEQRPAFQGIIQDGFVPSDQNIAVGMTYIVQVTNSEIAVLDKNGVMQPGYPKALSSLWTKLGGVCAQSNNGDPIVQYDVVAGRWIVTQLASLKNPYGECIAVSQTANPEGAYNLFSYSFGSNLNDYPKFSVWPTTTNSAYFATYNLFANGNTFAGAALCAYDRAAMLAVPPAPAAQICTTVSDGGVLPSDLDGSTAPPDGEPGYFLDFDSSSTLALRTFAPNFAAVPPTATITSLPDLSVVAFSEACGGGTCVPQPGQGRKLDSLGDRLMYRLAYRNFGGGHESIVVNHSIVAQGGNVGLRWYLLDSPSSNNGVANFSVVQGTYSPDSTAYRWMGSIAMDKQGDMALGYSLSSTSTYPSIAVTGRLASDPITNGIGNMGNEIILLAGGGAQTGTNRWGDYSSMRIDPSDDCTFWYTNQYYPTTSAANWYTYIGAFRFSACGGGGSFTLSPPGTVTVNGGGSDSSSHVTVMPTGNFNSAVTLSATCVAPITCSFNPNPVPGGSTTSTVTVTVAANAPSGTTTETITGNSAGLIDSKTFLVDIPPAQFTLAASPTSTTIKAGSNGSVTITAKDVAAASGSTKSVVALTPSTSQLSSGITATLSSSSINSNGGSTTLKITVPRGVRSGTAFSFTISGSDGPPANNQNVTVKGTTR